MKKVELELQLEERKEVQLSKREKINLEIKEKLENKNQNENLNMNIKGNIPEGREEKRKDIIKNRKMPRKNKMVSFEDESKNEVILNKKMNDNGNIRDKIRNNISFRKYVIIYLIIMISFIQIVLPYNNLYFIVNKFSNITLKIKGTGIKNILCPIGNFERKNEPNIIFINGEIQSPIKRKYDLIKQII